MKDIIVGCSHMGSGLAMKLQEKGHEVTIIDRQEDSFKKVPSGFSGQTIVGFGIDKEVLEAANINRADAVVTCTDSDETNALLARIAKNEYGVPRVIARIYDPRKADIYQSFGIQTISPIMWGIQRVTELLSYNQLDNVWVPENGNVEMIRIETPPLLIGHAVRELGSVGEIKVVTIARENNAFIPVSGTILEAHDVLYIVVATSAISKLKAMLGLE
ncbi:potassium channel family protein [Bacillus sp. 1NLA3E]|uniref:potassium channel family protein n=1 Tax=Bacillus sp. 1NLA3E TaxID=666686 RepID=UPI000247EDD5|nr:TrkA family potassium uptake protein [Bacillus sp. 1NLA3E]AGK53704.1 TrkA-N domain-containing protein [Bacillus sp. 1NLA3E]